MKGAEAQRQAFEDWISKSPYEKSVQRWPDDPTKYGWPGNYADIGVQLAWEAWIESAKYEHDW